MHSGTLHICSPSGQKIQPRSAQRSRIRRSGSTVGVERHITPTSIDYQQAKDIIQVLCNQPNSGRLTGGEKALCD